SPMAVFLWSPASRMETRHYKFVTAPIRCGFREGAPSWGTARSRSMAQRVGQLGEHAMEPGPDLSPGFSDHVHRHPFAGFRLDPRGDLPLLQLVELPPEDDTFGLVAQSVK